MGLSVLFLTDSVIDMATDRRAVSNRVIYHPEPVFSMAVAHLPQPPSLGVALLAAVLRREGHEVDVVESALHPLQRKRLDQALAARPDAICVSTTFIVRLENVKQFLAQLRRAAPGVPILMGGPSVMMKPEFRLLGDCDIVGDGEITLPKILREIEEGTFVAGQRSVQGEFQQDLDALPFPDWSALRRRSDEFFSVTTQRGCAWRCAFCTYPIGEGFLNRYRSVESVLAELLHNYETYGITRYFFTDSTFTHPPERCLELLRKISALPFRIEWFAYARIDTLSPALVTEMVRSGCVALYLGIESGDDGVLKKMRKGYDRSAIFKAIDLLKDTGIIKMGSWVVGFPGETPDSAEATKEVFLRAACELNGVHVFYLEDLAPVGKHPEQFHVEGRRFDWKTQGGLDAAAAEGLANCLIKEAVRHRLLLGGKDTLFNFSSIGWSLRRTMEAFHETQRYFALNEGWVRGESAEREALKSSIHGWSGSLREQALAHPVFARRKDV